MSRSLNPANRSPTNAPVWTHTKDVRVNHELDSLHDIFDTINDGSEGFTDQNKLAAIREHIVKRVATLQIGSNLGYSKVPNSDLLQSFAALNVDQLPAQQIISTGPQRQQTRSTTSGRGGGSSRGRRSGRSRATPRTA